MNIDYRSEVGKIREKNEDSVIVKQIGDFTVVAVADGMGGQQNGEVASSVAVNALVNELQDILTRETLSTDEQYKSMLTSVFQRVNKAVVCESLKTGLDDLSMGTTLTCAIINARKLYLAHIGDSRAYLIHGSAMTRLTNDHTYAQKLADEGKIPQQEVLSHEDSHKLVRWLGENSYINPDVYSYNIIYGDLLLLCTDGMYRAVDDSRILQCVKKHNDLKGCLDNLFEAAYEGGSDDNVTSLLVHIRP